MEANENLASLTLADVAAMLSMTAAARPATGRQRSDPRREHGPRGRTCKRARWRVSPAAVAAFQQARSNQPADIAPPDPAVEALPTPKSKGGEEFV